MPGRNFDVVVLGVGSMGSAACYYLAKSGMSVLGIEQFSIPNELSSHAGQSRLIRKAYYEHPGYVPLLQRAFDNWKHLEAITREQVYFETGLLYCARHSHPVMKGIHQSANEYNISLENIDNTQMRKQFPPFNIPDSYEKILEPVAGFITPGKAIQLYAQKAADMGAVIFSNTRVISWNKRKDDFHVQTAGEHFYAKKLVVTAGAWSGNLLPAIPASLTVTRQVLAWMKVQNPSMFELYRMPCWIIAEEQSPGIWYGFPILAGDNFEGPIGFKLAHHFPGEITFADTIKRLPSPQDEAALIRVMHKYFPGAYVSTMAMKICMYTNTPDDHFIIDYLPGYENDVIVATGFSGHGFKFASAVGEIISDLTIKGFTPLPIEFLKFGRFK